MIWFNYKVIVLVKLWTVIKLRFQIVTSIVSLAGGPTTSLEYFPDLNSHIICKRESESEVAQSVWIFVIPWTVVYQASLSMGFSRQEYWSGLPFPSPGDLPDPGIKPRSPALQADTLPPGPSGKPLPPEKPVCWSRSNSQNRTWNNGLVQNWERRTARLYIVTLLV